MEPSAATAYTRTMRMWLIALLVLLCGPEPTSAETPDQGAEGRLEQSHAALQAARLGGHFAPWPELSLSARDLARARLPRSAFGKLEQRVYEHLHPDVLQAGIARRYALDADDPRREALIQWREGALGSAIARAERSALSPAGLAAFPVFMSAVRAEPRLNARLALMRRVDEATRQSDSVLRIGLATAAAFDRGLSLLSCGADVNPSQRSAFVEQSVSRHLVLLRSEVRVGLLFTFRDLSRPEVRRYADFVESEEGRWVYGALDRHLGSALLEARAALDEELARDRTSLCGGASRSSDAGYSGGSRAPLRGAHDDSYSCGDGSTGPPLISGRGDRCGYSRRASRRSSAS